VDYNQYSAAKPANETDMPELSLKSSDKILLQYSIPTNYFAYNSRGVEFDIDFGRINSIRTSFGLNGSWTQYKSWKNYYTFNWIWPTRGLTRNSNGRCNKGVKKDDIVPDTKNGV